MEEFIFGTVAIDDLKLVHHRVSHSGVQHAHEIDPRDPEPGEPVTVTVRISPDTCVDHVACYYTTDGSLPEGSRGRSANAQVIQLHQVDSDWDTFQWGYITRWQAVLPGQPAGTMLRYRISAWSGDATEIFADYPDVKATTDRTAGDFFHGKPLTRHSVGDPAEGKTFAFHFDHLSPPQWAREAVIYHIFVDRFFPGNGRDWLQTEDLHDFFGGTLWGVTEKLDYIRSLGATAVWLSPIFPSDTTHGYDATDYDHVAERFGGDQALHTLVAEAHQRGIRIILDLVCNHVSDGHPVFQDAYKNPRSPYRDWFFFDDPNTEYRTFFGVRTMPQVNLASEGARQWMFDLARYWLREFDVDGFRLDHANGPGPEFWPDFWRICKQEKPDSFVFGEVVEPAPVLERYIGRMDGTLDFLLADMLRRTYGYRTVPRPVFRHFLQTHLEYFPRDFLMPTFLDNHDMDRFLFLAGNDTQVLREAAELQMKLPGPPVIYYGTEVGMSQLISKSSKVGLEASRSPMIWDDGQDRELLAFYQDLLSQRAAARPWDFGPDLGDLCEG
jgi:cyclomaltodextrinase / maltogenic alpha-amylase / neopullulanase